MGFVHLHVHSNYSFCRGANSIQQLCAAAQSRGMTHLALTDLNGVYGLGWFLEIVRAFNLKPIIGAHLVKNGSECVVLAKNINGYRFLCKSISRIHNEEKTELYDLVKNHNNVFLFSNDVDLLRRLDENGKRENVYGELRPFGNREHVLQYCRRHNIPPVATNGVFFVEKKDWHTHHLLRAIDLNTTLKRTPDDELSHRDACFRSVDEMKSLFPDCPEAISNTEKIAHECEFQLDFGDFVFPQFQSPGMNLFAYLKEQVDKGIFWRYGEFTPTILQRRDYELKIIRNKGFASYFLVLADVANKVKLTCGRGSAAASLVSYALGITHVDPIKYNLFFERFLNEGRRDPPDIDVDFAWDERDTVLKYLFQRYGPENTAMIANHNTFKARSAVREIAKVYGLPDSEIGTITKKMMSYWQPGDIWELTQSHPIYREIEFPQPWPEIILLAEKIRGYPRHMSLHCGGVVITPQSLDHYVPYQPAKKVLLPADNVVKGSGGIEFSNNGNTINVVQWEKEQSEDMKLVKMDILGNRSLAVIRDALEAVKENYGIEIDYTSWNPYDDEQTIERFYNGDTMGVFYFESPATRQLLKKVSHGILFENYLNSDHFQLNVVVTSIIRPASNQYIQDWVARLHGEKWQHLHSCLEKVLGETLGVMVYQEQMSQTAMAMAGFNPADADMLRKIVNKKHKAKELRDFYLQFKNGARKNRVADDIIEKVWQMIMSFDGYSFCKPHSASYTLVAYKSAYLRAHYPAEFIAAVISNRGGYYSTFGYISEAKRMGITVLMPDINASQYQFVGKDGTLRIGFMQLKGLTHKAIDAILCEKKSGPFQSFDDFMRRIHLVSSDVKILIKAGCFDAVEDTPRPQLLWQLQYHQIKFSRPTSTTLDLFEETPSINEAISREELPQPLAYDEEIVLQHEVEILGFLVSKHPLTLYRKRIIKKYVPAKDLAKFVGKRVRTIGWFIAGKTVSTKKNELMEFISFEDTTALYETTFFPKAFSQFVYMLSKTRPYILEGIVEENFGAVTLTVEHAAFI